MPISPTFSAHPSSPPPVPLDAPSTVGEIEPELNTIHVEYHPRSGRGDRTVPLDSYCRERPKPSVKDLDDIPWKSFNSRDDFELAEVILGSNMNTKMAKQLLRLIKRVHDHTGDLSLFSYEDLTAAWERTETLYPGVRWPFRM